MINLIDEYSTESHVEVEVTKPSHTTKVSMRDLKKGYYAGESFDELSSDAVSMEMENKTKFILLGLALGGLAIGLFLLIRKLREGATDKLKSLNKVRSEVMNERVLAKTKGADADFVLTARNAYETLNDKMKTGDTRAREVFAPYIKRWCGALRSINQPSYIPANSKSTLDELLEKITEHCAHMPSAIKKCNDTLAEFNKVALSGDLDGGVDVDKMYEIQQNFSEYWSNNPLSKIFSEISILKDTLSRGSDVEYYILHGMFAVESGSDDKTLSVTGGKIFKYLFDVLDRIEVLLEKSKIVDVSLNKLSETLTSNEKDYVKVKMKTYTETLAKAINSMLGQIKDVLIVSDGYITLVKYIVDNRKDVAKRILGYIKATYHEEKKNRSK